MPGPLDGPWWQEKRSGQPPEGLSVHDIIKMMSQLSQNSGAGPNALPGPFVPKMEGIPPALQRWDRVSFCAFGITSMVYCYHC